MAVDLALIDPADHRRTDLALAMVNTATQHDAHTFYRRRSVPGLGTIVSLVLLDAIHDIRRFPRGQAFVSSCRLGTCAHASAGKRAGTSGTKMGHAALTWAFSEAAVLGWRHHPAGQPYLARLAQQHGQGKALTMLAPTLARAVYDRLTRDIAFDRPQSLPGSGRGAGEPRASRDDSGSSLAMARCNA
jgi:transposase